MAGLIHVIGSLNVDLITRTQRMPSAGETLHSTSYSTGCGGKGANQAVACARLSRPNAFLSKSESAIEISMTGAVGSDGFGQDLIASLQQNGINTAGIQTEKDGSTGVAVIIVEESTSDNRILLSPNANFSLRPQQFSPKDPILHPANQQKPDLLILQLEIPLDTTLAIISSASSLGVPVLVNPAPAQAFPKETWKDIEHLIVNETEAAIISSHSLDTPLKTTLKHLATLPVPHITITLGSEGLLYLHNGDPTATGSSAAPGSTSSTSSSSITIFSLPAEKVTVRDTTAAGDTFVGAYAVGVVSRLRARTQPQTQDQTATSNPKEQPAMADTTPRRLSFEEMCEVVSWANKAASKTVEREGAQDAIPWLDEVPSLDAESQALSRGTRMNFSEWLDRK